MLIMYNQYILGISRALAKLGAEIIDSTLLDRRTENHDNSGILPSWLGYEEGR